MYLLRRPLPSILLAAVLTISGCAESDTEAPAAPRLFVEATQTAMPHTVLHGTAEYGARVTISRVPAAAEELAPGLTADTHTAEFSAEVPLELGVNVFRVTAIDQAGNRSEPTSLTVHRVKAAPTSLSLASAVTLIEADDGAVELVAQLRHDEPIPLEGMEVLFSAEHEAGAAEVVTASAISDAQGRARTTLAGLSVAGIWRVTATSKDDETQTDSLTLLVRGGAPTSLELILEAEGLGGVPVSGEAITVAPDAVIRTVATVLDAPRNELQVPVTLYTDAPGALVAGSVIRGVTVVGKRPYRVVAVAGGSGASGEATFQVVPGNLASLTLKPSKTEALAGEPVALQIVAQDAWGNQLGDPEVTFEVAPPLDPTWTPPGSTQTFTGQGIAGRTFRAYDLSAVANAGYRFNLTAHMPSSNVEASASVVVRPPELSLTVSAGTTAPGIPILASVEVRDLDGRPLGCPAGAPEAALELTSTLAGAAGPLACADGIFSRTFTWSEHGSYKLQARWLAGPASRSTLVTVAGDALPPTVTIPRLMVDGVPCGGGAPSRCTLAPGALVEFDAAATDETALAQLAYHVYFESSDTERARTLLISGGSRSHTERFSFTVPANTRPEQTVLVARAGDLGGNVAHTPEVVLDVSLGAFALGGRTLSIVSTDMQGLAEPSDLVQLPSGDLIVANRGTSSLSRLATGSKSFRPFATLTTTPALLALDGSGRLYVGTKTSRSLRIAADGSSEELFTSTFSHSGGLALSPPTPQRAFVRGVNTAADGNSVTIDSGPLATTYEIDLDGSCTQTSGRICVAVGAGGSIAAALANAINGNADSRVLASAESTTPATRVALASKTPGEPTSPIALGATGSLSVVPFAGGHGEEAWVPSNSSLLAPRTPLRRFPLGGNLPWTATAHGAFELDGALALAIRDVWTADSATTTDLVVYNATAWNSQLLKAYRLTADPSGSTVTPFNPSQEIFALGSGLGVIRDIALRPDGRCLLVAGQEGPGQGRLWALDVADPANTAPTSELLLDGLQEIGGISWDDQGHALVLDSSAEVLYRLAPASPLPAGGCF